MKKSIQILLMAIALLPAIVQAQDTLPPALPASWTLENSIAYALQHNISVSTQRLSTRSAQEDLLQSRAAKLPNLTGAASASLVNSNNADPVVGGFTTQASFSNNYSLSSSIVLYNGGYLKKDIEGKELAVAAASLNVAQTANDITLSITQSYLNILLAKENIVYLDDLLTTSKEQLKQATQRYEAGSLSKKDYLQFQSQVASDEYNLVNARNAYAQNVLTLKQLLLLPTEYRFEVSVPSDLAQLPSTRSLTDALDAAQQTRPEVQLSELAIKQAEVNLALAKTATRPTVSLGANLSSGYSDNQTNPYLKQLNNNFYQSIGLNVSIPIYNRRVNKTAINKSNIAIEQARLAMLDTRNTLNQQVEQAWTNWQNAQAQYVSATTQLKTSEESYAITNEQLKYGSVNMVEVMQQKTLYVQATQSFIQARYSSILYSKIYDFYAGIPVTL
ncbi:MAG: TolC family protein [Candidatus Pseudobacter hemicellulosilyticus]|uniref:TolC family protein n=1 Tax=Candidatus Pseudobacter hemicellulosilyticus TaxID=3121375 RepID=A0AAJ6BG29_9BACT|nr:MAG: TolC family protein [Pseudobacter sp.]